MSTQARWDARLEAAVLLAARAAARRWLPALNAAVAIFIALALLAPLLLAHGHTRAARALYSAYRLTCHQEAQRSYFLGGPRLVYSRAELEAHIGTGVSSAFSGNAALGYKLAFCQRDLATYTALLLFGLFWPRLTRRLPRLPLRAYVLLLAPLAVDGLTQATGLRESTWFLRTITGGLFGFATAWLLLPELDLAIAAAVHSLSNRLRALQR